MYPAFSAARLVAVVAHEAELLSGEDRRLPQRAQPARASRRSATSSRNRRCTQRWRRSTDITWNGGRRVRERPVGEPDQRETDLPLARGRGSSRGSRSTRPATSAGATAVLAEHEHLGQRHQRPEGGRREVAQVVARRGPRGSAARRRRRRPAESAASQPLRNPSASWCGGPIQVWLIPSVGAGEQHDGRHRDVGEDDQRHRDGGPAPYVPEHEQRQAGEQQVLRDRVDDVRILGVREEPLDDVPDGEPGET